MHIFAFIWSNYSDLTRPHPKRWFSKGNPLISGKSRLVKYSNLARFITSLGLKIPTVFSYLGFQKREAVSLQGSRSIHGEVQVTCWGTEKYNGLGGVPSCKLT